LGKYTLIITEKPDAASRIAAALDLGGNVKKTVAHGVPYYQVCRNGDVVIVPALGHLYTLAEEKKGKRDYPVFSYRWVPRYVAERKASRIRVWLEVISKLAEDADVFVDACDFDVEGSIIGYCILKFACGGKEQTAKRMKYSTLTKEELQESYDHLLSHLDFSLVQAGLTRHEVDWLYGINLSRALTSAAQGAGGRYATISTGRVQGPTLKFLEEREKAVRSFVPTPYWTITAKIDISGVACVAEYEKILQTKQEATQVMAACKAKEGVVEAVAVEEFALNPPFPFDLGALQSEAYRIFRYTPMRTSSVAQRLYLDALISYPRTSSQKLLPTIGYKTILRKLAKVQVYAEQASELLSKPILKPSEGGKVDSAHPAIYPTGNLPQKPLGVPEKNIFDLVVRRFMAVFGEPARRQAVKVTLSLNGNRFSLNGARTLSEGWLGLYKPYHQVKDDFLPPVTVGQKVAVKRVVLKDDFTKPPSRYNPRSLLLKMEQENIGTKATRAATIQTLLDRKYLFGTDAFGVSELGFEVTEILSSCCPTVVLPELTRSLEREMDEVQQGIETKEAVLQNAVSVLKPVISELKAKEQVIGQRLSQALKNAWVDQRTLGVCPKCHEGKLVILRSKTSGKRFVGCTNYFEGKCNLTFPLPQRGEIKPLKSACRSCGCPVVSVWLKRKQPWKLCLNPNCPSKGANKTVEM
jgi:DNA topoisomerase-1